MDFREAFLTPLSKLYIDRIVQEIEQSPESFNVVYHLIFDNNKNIAWRAAWACQKLSIKHPDWFSEKSYMALSELALTTSHSGLQRGCLAILSNLTVPSTISVDFINACFDWMQSTRSAIAVQAYSMKLLYSISIKEPAFKSELLACLESMDVHLYSSGLICTRKNIINSLNNKRLKK
jgi:hypothetical protein